MFTELSLGCLPSGHRNLSMYEVFVFHSVFLCQLHAHTCPLYNVVLEVVCFPRFTHDDVHRVADLYFSTEFHDC